MSGWWFSRSCRVVPGVVLSGLLVASAVSPALATGEATGDLSMGASGGVVADSGPPYTMTELGASVAGVDDVLRVTALNGTGQVVGWTSDPEQLDPRAWVWDPRGGLRYLSSRVNHSIAVDNNDRGQVVGTVTKEGRTRAFRWDPRTGKRYLSTPRGYSSPEPAAINASGQVVGTVLAPDPNNRRVFRGFIWDPRTGMRVLRPLRGDQHSNALGINSAGQVIGHSWNPRRERSFRWDPKTGKSDLGSLGGGFTSVSAINDRGQVVGGSSTPTGEDRAFRWSPKTGMTDLGTFGGESSGALAINCGGQVTGSAATESGANHAFVWDSRHGMTDLGTLGGESSGALAINCGGQVTGSAATESGANHAFVWDLRHGMTDLGTLGGNQVSTGLDINRRGQVAGTSSIGDYSYVGSDDWATAVLWSPRVTVAVKAVHERTRLRLDVNPNLRAAHWRVTIQKRRADRTWAKVPPTHRTEGRFETLTLDLGRGTYRVVVKAQYGYDRATSSALNLRR